MKRILFFLLIIVLLEACESSKQTSLPVLNFEEILAEKVNVFPKESLKVVSIIPLETTEASLLDEIVKVIPIKNYFFVLDMQRELKVFDRQGKFYRKIGQVGQGPQEYTMLTDFAVNKDKQEVYINSLRKAVVYDFEGNFKREFSLDDGNLQVLTCFKDKLFYIYPEKTHPNTVKTAPLISVFNLDGKKQKEIPALQLRRVESFPMFNSISSGEDAVYYKEETGKILYTVKENFAVDSLCVLDFGKYAFKPEDFNLSKRATWQQYFRLQNILPAKDFMIFMLQKGLMEQELAPFIWNKKDNTISRFEYEVAYNGRNFSVLPFAVFENKIIGTLVGLEDGTDGIDAENPFLVELKFTEPE